MITNKNILELETRKQIYNTILKYPGLHLQELSRKTELSISSLRHHLNILVKQDYVVKISDRRYTRYYISKKVGRTDKKLFNLLRQDIPRKIVLVLLIDGPAEIYKGHSLYDKQDPSIRTNTCSKKEMVGVIRYWKKPYDELFHLQKHRTTIDFHLNKLIDADIVERIPSGKEIEFKLKDDLRIWLFLAKHKKTLSDTLVDLILKWGNHTAERFIDPTMEVIWEIFPHPYHA